MSSDFQEMRHPSDLFASRNNAVVPHYFSVEKGDLRALACNAFHQKWDLNLMCAFCPHHLISQSLGKLVEVPGELILIAPLWPDAL